MSQRRKMLVEDAAENGGGWNSLDSAHVIDGP